MIRRKAPPVIIAALLLIATIPQAYAELERDGPISPANGYPIWYQDKTGLTMEMGVVLNQDELAGGWVLLLPIDIPSQTAPEIFPTNFGEEHFYWAGGSIIPFNLPNGTATQAELVLGLEAAFGTGPVAVGDQVVFGRVRIRIRDVPFSGTYTVYTPYGIYSLPNQVAGTRAFFTEDIGIASPGVFTEALRSNIGPFLLPSLTPGGAELPPVPGPVPGKLYIGDPARIGPVTGSVKQPYQTSNGVRNPNIFRIEGPNGFVIESFDFNVVGRIYTGTIPSRVSVDRASYTLLPNRLELNVFCTGLPTTQARLPGAPKPPISMPLLSFFNAPPAVDPISGALGPPAGFTEIPMASRNTAYWGQSLPPNLPLAVTVKDSNARDAVGNVIPYYYSANVTDAVVITEARYKPTNNTLTVKAYSTDKVAPTPALSLADFGPLVNGEITTVPIAAVPSVIRVNSAAGGTNTAQVVIDSNEPPVAVNDSYQVNLGATLNVAAPGVLGNDTDPNGDPLTAILATPPGGGVLNLNADGSFSFTPPTPSASLYTFTYMANDGTVNSNPATVIITVNGPPVAVNDAYSVNQGAILNIGAPGVLANDNDPNGGPLTALLVSGPASGTLTLNPNGSLTYEPGPSTAGDVTFTYVASDGALNSLPATVTIHVNAPPAAANDTYQTTQGVALNVAAAGGVLANDSDPNGDPLTASLVSGPASGNLVLNADGSFTYTPAVAFTGNATFTYLANDGLLNSTVATVTIKVNGPPVGVVDAYRVNQGATLNVPAASGVLANDSDPNGDPLSAIIANPPTSGTLTLNPDGSFTYIPIPGFTNPVTFTYRASDGILAGNPTTVTLALNVAPVAQNDSYRMNPGTTLNVAAAGGVLANDTDSNGDGLTAILVTPPANGNLTLNADGSFGYAAAPGITGSVTFTYRVNDGLVDGNEATVTITLNTPPVTVADSYRTNRGVPLNVPAATGVLANDSDPNGDPLTAIMVSGPASGTLTLNPDGSLAYAPAVNFAGNDAFTYKTNDGLIDGNTVTVNITVNGPPVSVSDIYGGLPGTTIIVPAASGLLANDSDPNGDPLTAVLVTPPSSGELTLQPNGSLTYVPAIGLVGNVSFTYQASDGTLSGNTATVTFAYNSGPPTALDEAYAANAGVTLSVPAASGVLANDTDPSLLPLGAVLVSPPATGSLTLNGDGSFSYTPATISPTVVTFTYKANNGALDSNVATVTFNVNGRPVALNDSFRTTQGLALNVPAPGLLANDSDPDGDPLTAIVLTQPANGLVALNANGSFTYTPTATFAGTVTFTYRLNDGKMDSNPATVAIVVAGPPVAVNNSYNGVRGTTLSVPANTGVLANDSDPNGDPLTAILVSPPAAGTLTLNANGSFTFTPPAAGNSFSFTYMASDGAQNSNVATVTINYPPADTVLITFSEYRTGLSRLQVTATSTVVSPTHVLTLLGGSLFADVRMTNLGGGRYSAVVSGIPQPPTIRVISSQGGDSGPQPIQRVRQ